MLEGPLNVLYSNMQTFRSPCPSCTIQCAAVYAHFTETLEGWNEASRDFLARARDTGAMCGMPLEDVTQLQPATNFLDVAAAFFKSECDNPAMVTGSFLKK